MLTAFLIFHLYVNELDVNLAGLADGVETA
jgi:hypothetical protein